MKNGLSIDVEDYYQIVCRNYFQKNINPSIEVEKNTSWLLDNFGEAHVKATFFVLANVARRYPSLLRRMAREGHEIGIHGYEHNYIYTLQPDEFRRATAQAKDEIENIAGCAVYGHRAPAFSITKESFWAIDILKELGFVYDSSIYPIKGRRYGIPDAKKNIYRWRNGLFEIPLSCIKLFGKIVPVAGGGYIRYFPYRWTKYAISCLQKIHRPAIVFMHPYEFESAPPAAYPYELKLPLKLKFHNFLQALNRGKKQREKLLSLLEDFTFTPLINLLDPYDLKKNI